MPRKARAAPAATTSAAKRQRKGNDAREPDQAVAVASIAASTAASASDLRWGSLAMDVLQVIASNVPLRPRLLVVSLVCKRWREAVRRAPTHLPGLRPDAYGAACKFLTNITSMTLEHIVPILRPEYRPIIDATATINSLTSLSVLQLLWRNDAFPYSMLLQPLVTNCRSTLVSLSLEFNPSASKERIIELLVSTDLPALRNLSLKWVHSSPRSVGLDLVVLLKKLSPQLHHLSLTSSLPCEELHKAVQDLRFPVLSHLTVQLYLHLGGLRASRPIYLADMDRFAEVAPNATRLDVGNNSEFVTGKWRPLLTHVVIRYGRPSKNFSMYEFPQLTSVDLKNVGLLDPLPAPLPTVRTVRLERIFEKCEWLASFPCMTSLSVTETDSLMTFASLVQGLLQSAVRLRHLSFKVGDYHTPPSFIKKQVAPLLPRLEAHGLETLRLHTVSSINYAELVPLARQLTWLRMTVWHGP